MALCGPFNFCLTIGSYSANIYVKFKENCRDLKIQLILYGHVVQDLA